MEKEGSSLLSMQCCTWPATSYARLLGWRFHNNNMAHRICSEYVLLPLPCQICMPTLMCHAPFLQSLQDGWLGQWSVLTSTRVTRASFCRCKQLYIRCVKSHVEKEHFPVHIANLALHACSTARRAQNSCKAPCWMIITSPSVLMVVWWPLNIVFVTLWAHIKKNHW